MFYGNKTKNGLSGFSTSITSGEDILCACREGGAYLWRGVRGGHTYGGGRGWGIPMEGCEGWGIPMEGVRGGAYLWRSVRGWGIPMERWSILMEGCEGCGIPMEGCEGWGIPMEGCEGWGIPMEGCGIPMEGVVGLELGAALTRSAQLSFQQKPVASSVDSGAQVQEVINVECLAPFMEAPRITIKFR